VKYGQTRESVLGLEVVMADGTVVRTGGKNVKDVAGYSLTHLIVGSQGTLALITEATLRLRPAPPPRATLLAFFPTLQSAGEAVTGIAAAGLSPVTLELMDQFTIRAVDDVHALGLDRDAAAMLMIESDLPEAAAADELARAEVVCAGVGAITTIRSQTPAEADLLRQARRAAHWALEKIGDVKMEDVGVPRSRVPDMLRAIEAIALKHDVRIGTFGHAGDGNLHPDLVLERGDPRGEQITKAVQEDLYRAALDLGGTVTGEHGIGSARREWLEPQRGTDAVRFMRAIKAALDPQGLLNPGRVL
jgi:glycolate oxidase